MTKARTTGRLQSGVREGLVALQFAIVIAVLIATIVVHRQTAFGMRESLRQSADPTLLLRTRCNDAIKDALSRVPGVKGTACAGYVLQAGVGGVGPVQYNGGERLVLAEINVGIGYFELYDIALAAGRYFSEDFGADQTPKDGKWTVPESIILNESGVAKLGLPSPQAAIGQMVNINHPSAFAGTFSGEHTAQIVGVVKDFQIGSVRRDIYPAVFFVDPLMFGVLSLKLDGRQTPETLEAVDRIWAQMGDRPGPADHWFFEQTVQNIYGDLRRDFELFTVFAERRDPDLGARPRRARCACGVGPHEGDRGAEGAREWPGRHHGPFDVAVLAPGTAREPDCVARGVSRDEQLARGLCATNRPRGLDVRRGRAGDACGRRAHGRGARVGDRGRAAGGGATARVRGGAFTF